MFNHRHCRGADTRIFGNAGACQCACAWRSSTQLDPWPSTLNANDWGATNLVGHEWWWLVWKWMWEAFDEPMVNEATYCRMPTPTVSLTVGVGILVLQQLFLTAFHTHDGMSSAEVHAVRPASKNVDGQSQPSDASSVLREDALQQEGPRHADANPPQRRQPDPKAPLAHDVTREAGEPRSSSLSTRYITWRRNGGALNNQLISVAAAFDTAKSMGRTVYIEADATAMQENDPKPSLRWPKTYLGVDDGLWDLTSLEQEYSIEYETRVVRVYGSVAKHPVLGLHLNDSECLVPDLKHVQTMELLKKLDAKCPVIDLGGANGQLRFQEFHGEHGFFRVFRPGKHIVEAADKWLASVEWGTSSGKPALAVHSRSFWEGRKCTDAYQFCAGKVKSTFRLLGVHVQHPEVAAVMCFATPEAINLVLERSNLTNVRVENCTIASPSKPCMPWFLGADGQTNGIIESLATEYGAKMFDVRKARQSGLLRPPQAGSGLLVPPEGGYRKGKIHNQNWQSYIERLESSYIDLYLLSRGEVFIGNVYSTFSSSVCKMRPDGAPSNTCRFLTTHKPDEFISSLNRDGLPVGWHLPWIGEGFMVKRIVELAYQKDHKNIPCV